MKLNSQTTRKTDDQFYEQHPEMVKNGKRIPINSKNPAHKGMAGEWMATYRQNTPPPATPNFKSASKKANAPGQSVATCPFAASDKKTKPVPPCCFKGVTIQCGHSERSYTMSLPLSPAAIAKKETELHVIAGHTRPDKVAISLSGGPCNRGVNKSPNVSASSHAGKSTTSQSKISLDVFAPERKLTNIRQWRSMIWPNVTTDCLSYPVTAAACEGASDCSTVIKAFPYVKWTVSAGFSIPGGHTSSQSTGLEKRKHDTKQFIEFSRKSTGWTFKPITASLELDKGSGGGSKKFDLGAEFSSYVKTTLTVFQNFKDLSDVAGGFMSSMGGPEWTITYPTVELSYECETVELKGSPRVGVQGKFALALNPLIGLEFSYDVLNWLLGMANLYAPGLGTFLVNLKKRAEGGFFHKAAKVELSLKFTIGGTIDGNLACSKPEASAPKWTPSGEIAGKIDGSFIGKAAASVDAWIVSIGGGAELGGKTGVEAKLTAETEETGIFAHGKLGFTGVTFFYATYATLGRVSKAAKDEEPADDDGKSDPTYTNTREYQLVEPKDWPDGGRGKFCLISNS